MAWNIPYHLNIRQKIVVSLTLCLLIVGCIGWISYRHLSEIERKQHVMEIVDDLSNTILEIRRYEKNYLLYGLTADLDEQKRYLEEGLAVLAKIAPEMKSLQGAPQLGQLEQGFRTYRQSMEKMAECVRQGPHSCAQQVEDELREHGKSLVDLSLRLATFERERIIKIIAALKTQLVSSLIIFLAIGGSLIPIVARKIIRPLRVIEKTTLRIAQGDFSPVPVRDTRDETQRVVEAFNRMIAELQKRQDQLVQAKKLSSLGILTSGIAHQLNNPLNNISTSCQILLEEFGQADPAFSQKMLSNIEQEVHRARDIVRGLLEFSRVKEFALIPTSLHDVVERTVRLVSSQVPPGIELIREIPKDLVLFMDAQRIQQVFLNMIMNAVQAIDSPPGAIRITARLDEENQQAVVTIEDSGSGIEEKDLARIFDPFFTT
ncbi:MAG TPA: histidine kinase, partial [Syntrophobacteraceae bacterium]|nr:histidine kinase [Syntrophobacteraceae bacterium]